MVVLHGGVFTISSTWSSNVDKLEYWTTTPSWPRMSSSSSLSRPCWPPPPAPLCCSSPPYSMAACSFMPSRIQSSLHSALPWSRTTLPCAMAWWNHLLNRSVDLELIMIDPYAACAAPSRARLEFSGEGLLLTRIRAHLKYCQLALYSSSQLIFRVKHRLQWRLSPEESEWNMMPCVHVGS